MDARSILRLIKYFEEFAAMATTSAPQLNKKWFECDMDGEWSKSLANVRQITEEVLLRFLVNRAGVGHDTPK